MLLSGKVAIVSGATRGIGKSIACTLAKEGASLIINGTNKNLINEVKQEIKDNGGKCISVIGDISDPMTSKEITKAALENYGTIDILVNNAGVISRTSLEEMSMEEWDRTLDINLKGMLYLCLEVLPHMKEKKEGKIVNIASSAAKKAHPNASPSYGVSKAGMVYLTRHLALEMSKYGIHVNAICPGPIESDMSDQWTDEYREKVVAKIPLGRIGHPDEVAQVALFLASSMSDFICGEAININGGSFMD